MQAIISKITFLIEYMCAAFGILYPYKDLRRLKKRDVIWDWPLHFNTKEVVLGFVAIQVKVKIYFYNQKPKIHYGDILVEVRVVTEMVRYLSTQIHT